MTSTDIIYTTDADILCSKAKYHFDPSFDPDFSDSATQTSRGAGSAVSGSRSESYLETYKRHFQGLHSKLMRSMYFVVSKCAIMILCISKKAITFDSDCDGLLPLKESL